MSETALGSCFVAKTIFSSFPTLAAFNSRHWYPFSKPLLRSTFFKSLQFLQREFLLGIDGQIGVQIPHKKLTHSFSAVLWYKMGVGGEEKELRKLQMAKTFIYVVNRNFLIAAFCGGKTVLQGKVQL